MKLELRIDPKCAEPHVIIVASAITAEVTELQRRLSTADATVKQMVRARRGDTTSYIPISQVTCFWAQRKRVMCSWQGQDWNVAESLKTLSELLPAQIFQRVSNSAIVNLRFLDRFDIMRGGSCVAVLRDGRYERVTNMYLRAVKERILAS